MALVLPCLFVSLFARVSHRARDLRVKIFPPGPNTEIQILNGPSKIKVRGCVIMTPTSMN